MNTRSWSITFRFEMQFSHVFANGETWVYVNEHRSDQKGFTQWGPMKETFAPDFVQARVAELNQTAERTANAMQACAMRELGSY